MPQNTDFLDEAVVFVAGGKGGDGCVHFRREKFVPMGGPDGGDGGGGGSVVLRADPAINTLYSFRFRRRFVGAAGMPGAASRRHGKQAPDIAVPVPVGTLVENCPGGDPLADLKSVGDEFVAARGGQGGLGNSHFATSTRQAPSFAEKGQPGEERSIRLVLKLVADVGLVGLPNAGKSTLLAAMSAARPKVADYPFTTLTPNLGVVAMDDYTFVLADIPGLIEGAHEGHGLGDRFLRHIERTRMLVRVLDGSSESPAADFESVTQELRLYDPALAEMPQVVAVNKMDLPTAREQAQKLAHLLAKQGLEVVETSGATREGIDQLIGAIRKTLEALGGRTERSEAEVEEIIYRPPDRLDDFRIERLRSTFHVSGRTVERIVSMTDMESEQALERLQRQLKRLGVLQALEREGIRPGAKVSINGFELVWEGELEQGLSSPNAKASARKGSENPRQTRPGTRASRGRRRH